MRTQEDTLLLLYSPLKIAAIDDDLDFLDVITSNLTRDNLTSYNSPKDALQSIKPISATASELILESTVGAYDLNFAKIKDLFISCSEHHGVVISDYQMPIMNGIELLSNYANTDLIRLLLTGAYTIEDAVNALNKGVINYYLPKDNITLISDVVNELQLRFFKKLSADVLKSTSKDNLQFIEDSAYIKILLDTLKEYKAVRYCILNSFGAYLFETNSGNHILNIFHKDNLPEVSEWVPSIDRHAVLLGEIIPSYFSHVSQNNSHRKAERIGNYYFCIEDVEQ